MAPERPGRQPPPRTRRLRHSRPRSPNRWWLLPVAASALVLSTTVAVARTGNEPPEPARMATSGTGSRGSVGPSGVTDPGGVAGLGSRPPASPSASSSTGGTRFRGVRRTLPGASIHLGEGESFAEALARSDRSYGPLRMVRVFYPGLPPAWRGSRADVADRTVVVSFKAPPREILAGRHDTRLAGWFASIPRDHDVYWAYFHEPEDDVARGSYTAADFRAAWRRLAGLAERAGNPKLRATLILMCWTLNPQSNRRFEDYWPGGDVIDVLGWDCYNSGGKFGRYTDPEKVFAPMIAKSRALGKPWGLAETGSVRIPGDNGTGRAAWIRAASAYLNSQRPLWVAYYDYQVSGGDFRLTDLPSRQAWQAWCRGAA